MAELKSYSFENLRNGFAEFGSLGVVENGGKGSGNFGHSGRPGKRGGSGKGKRIRVTDKKTAMDEIERLDKEIQKGNEEDAALTHEWLKASPERQHKIIERATEITLEQRKMRKRQAELSEKYGLMSEEEAERRKETRKEEQARSDAMKTWKTGEKMSDDDAKKALDGVASDVMGGTLDDYDSSFKDLIGAVKSKQLTKKQVEQLMFDGKPELSADKKTIYMATRATLHSHLTSAKEADKDMKYYRREWKEIEEDY